MYQMLNNRNFLDLKDLFNFIEIQMVIIFVILVVFKYYFIFQVLFCNFFKSLLCGEVYVVMLQFINIGISFLYKLKLVIFISEFIILGGYGEFFKFFCVYQSVSEVSGEEIKCCCNIKDKVFSVMDISLFNRIFQLKNTVSVFVWVRGNDIGGVYDVYFMFYYEFVTINISKVRLVSNLMRFVLFFRFDR